MVDRAEIEQFLYAEARLMDLHQYDAWLALWGEDAHYWIPCNDDEIDIETHVSLVNENRRGIEDRIKRLKGGAAYAQDPKSRLSRTVSNVELMAVGEQGVEVQCTFLLAASRRGRVDLVAGRSFYTLRPGSDGWRIARKKVLLVDNDEVIRNLTFLI